MTRRITIDPLDVQSIDRAIRDLKYYKEDIKIKLHELAQKLAEKGLRVASLSYDQALYAGLNDVNVTCEETQNGYVIKASGTSVLFIEFGTGILNPEHPQSAEFGYKHGTYGKGLGKKPFGWNYRGERGNIGETTNKEGVYHTTGNPPSMSMYNAGKEIKRDLVKIAKEVFGND